MKALVLLLLTTLTGCGGNYEFHRGDRVEIIEGFDKGQRGVVESISWVTPSDIFCRNRYYIRLEGRHPAWSSQCEENLKLREEKTNYVWEIYQARCFRCGLATTGYKTTKKWCMKHYGIWDIDKEGIKKKCNKVPEMP